MSGMTCCCYVMLQNSREFGIPGLDAFRMNVTFDIYPCCELGNQLENNFLGTDRAPELSNALGKSH